MRLEALHLETRTQSEKYLESLEAAGGPMGAG